MPLRSEPARTGSSCTASSRRRSCCTRRRAAASSPAGSATLSAAGAPNAAIADRLDLAEKTVRNRVSQIVHWLSRTGSR
ncbi:hypothetical protein GCM10022255_020610 [Dactylosporangium darangshiense]|uniref:HTH luxR-type domain-containing protein n=1 Tax=Dactylosporangium darangshiense TaxID=579108 RepID=A0ABP8D433_9ACTN